MISQTPLLISTPTNITYLTGFTGVSPAEREAFVLMLHNQLVFFTNALYEEQAIKTLTSRFKHYLITTALLSKNKPLGLWLNEILEKERVSTLFFESDNLTVAESVKISKHLSKISLIAANGQIEAVRQIKQADELKSIRQACKLTDRCFTFILKQLKPGITESHVAWEIEKYFKEKGAGLAFTPIVAFGKNSSMPHYTPMNVKLKKNTLILLDFGARINGYCADMTRVVFFGKPTIEQTNAYTAVLTAQEKAVMLLKKGERSGSLLDQLTKESIQQSGFPPYQHSLGHGVGLDIHESPRLTVHKDMDLKSGMVVSVEPGTYIAGKFGIRIEDLVHIEKNRVNLLSTSDKSLIII